MNAAMLEDQASIRFGLQMLCAYRITLTLSTVLKIGILPTSKTALTAKMWPYNAQKVYTYVHNNYF